MVLPEFRPGRIDPNAFSDGVKFSQSWMDRSRKRKQEEEEEALLAPLKEAKAKLDLATFEDRFSALTQSQEMTAEIHQKMPSLREEYTAMLNTPLDAPNRYQALSQMAATLMRYSEMGDRFPEVQGMLKGVSRELDFMEYQRKKQWEWENTPARGATGRGGTVGEDEVGAMWNALGMPTETQKKARERIAKEEELLEKGNLKNNDIFGIGGTPREEIIAEQTQKAVEEKVMVYKSLMTRGGVPADQVREDILERVRTGLFTPREAEAIARELGFIQ